MALVLVAALGPHALADDPGGLDPLSSFETPTDPSAEQPATAAPSGDGDGGTVVASTPEPAWTLWLERVSVPDADGDTAARPDAQVRAPNGHGEDGGAERDVADPRGRAAQDPPAGGVEDAPTGAQVAEVQQPDGGPGCGTGCSNVPEDHGDDRGGPGAAAATAAAGGGGPPSDRPPGWPTLQPSDPRLPPSERERWELRRRNLEDRWRNRDAADAAKLVHEHGRTAREQSDHNRVWAKRTPDPARMAEQQQKIDQALANRLARHADAVEKHRQLMEDEARQFNEQLAKAVEARATAAARPAASRRTRPQTTPFDTLIQRAERRWRESGGTLDVDQVAEEIRTTRQEAVPVRNWLLLRDRVRPYFEQEVKGQVPEWHARRLAQVLANDNPWISQRHVADVDRVLTWLRRHRGENQNPMSMVDQTASLAAPPTVASDPLPALPPTVGDEPDIPGMPPLVEAGPDAVTRTPGYGGRTPDTAVPPSLPTSPQELRPAETPPRMEALMATGRAITRFGVPLTFAAFSLYLLWSGMQSVLCPLCGSLLVVPGGLPQPGPATTPG